MSSRLRIPVLFAAGILVLQLGWALSFAPFWGMDEPDHLFRAASVAAGHWTPATDTARPEVARGEKLTVPESLARAAQGPCELHLYHLRGNCVGMPAPQSGKVTIYSAAGRYDPVYYAVVGLLARPFAGDAYVYAVRAATALLSCLFLVAALWSTRTWARTGWPMLGLLTALTPTTLYSTAVASPSGVHVASAVALWCALLGLAHDVSTRSRKGLLAVAGVSAAATVLTHSLGVLWVPLILLTAWLFSGRPAPRRALATSAERRWALLVAVSYLAAVAWVALARTNSPANELTGHMDGGPLSAVVLGWIAWPLQAIAAAPNRPDHAPVVVYGLWFAALVALLVVVVPVLRRNALRDVKAGLWLVLVLSFAIPSVLTFLTYHQLGMAWQGRYGYPLGVGLLLILAAVADRTRPLPTGVRGLLVALLVTGQVLAQVGARDRSLRTSGLVEATHWHPPSTLLLLGCGIVAGVLLIKALAAPVRPSVSAAERAVPSRTAA